MERKERGKKLEEIIGGIYVAWSYFGLLFFALIGFVLGLLSFYKIFNAPTTLIIGFKILSFWIFGLVVLFILSFIIFLMNKYILPEINKRQKKRKKEFFDEVTKQIRKEIKSKK
jgi:H+/Cl- antiporter ClcA|tara:strand:+ start:677 stop:1018 length:342 start_codon:yes stop_codon:yes gene_type:complete